MSTITDQVVKIEVTPTETICWYQYVPEGGSAATTVLEVLENARELLGEEGRWISGEWFQNKHPEADPEDPFCNSWAVCAQGAIGVASVGASRWEYATPDAFEGSNGDWQFDDYRADLGGAACPSERVQLYKDAVKALEKHLPNKPDYPFQYGSIPEWNDDDDRTRTEVIAIFDKAIKDLKNPWRVHTPEGFDGPPETVSDALRQARAVLAAEGAWMKGSWFLNRHPEVDPEDPFCNSWQVCAEGAVGLVTHGVYDRTRSEDPASQRAVERGVERFSYIVSGVSTADEHDRPEVTLYHEALALLVKAGKIMFPNRYQTGSANDINDSLMTTRTQVLAWFDLAIAITNAREAAGRMG